MFIGLAVPFNLLSLLKLCKYLQYQYKTSFYPVHDKFFQYFLITYPIKKSIVGIDTREVIYWRKSFSYHPFC